MEVRGEEVGSSGVRSSELGNRGNTESGRAYGGRSDDSGSSPGELSSVVREGSSVYVDSRGRDVEGFESVG